jgi:hypothetical protein
MKEEALAFSDGYVTITRLIEGEELSYERKSSE